MSQQTLEEQASALAIMLAYVEPKDLSREALIQISNVLDRLVWNLPNPSQG